MRPAAWVRGYPRAWLSGDLVAGVAAGSVVIPQAMAYATVADAPVEVGLYTCMVPMAVYALLGGSRILSVSTTSTVAVLSGSTLLAADVAAGADDPARSLATLTVLVGVILLAARLLRLGGLIDNISKATLTGIKAGVGLTVAAGQLPRVLGVQGDPTADAFFAEVAGVVGDLAETDIATVALSVASIVVLVVLGRAAPQVPAPLIIVAGGIALVAATQIDENGLALIDPVPAGLPGLIVPTSEGWVDLLPGALAIAVMCFMETAAVARAVRERDEPTIDNNDELVANGLACVVGGMFRALPAAGGFSQTAMNRRCGARTQLASLTTVALAVSCALFLGGVLSDLPRATLACLVIVAVVGLIEPMEFVRYWRIDRFSFWVAAATAAGGLVFGLLAAVLIGVVLTLLLVVRELSHIGFTVLELDAYGDLVPASRETTAIAGVVVVRFDGPLYAANVSRIRHELDEMIARDDPNTVVFDLTSIPEASITVVDEMADLEDTLGGQGITVWYSDLSAKTLSMLRHTSKWSEVEAGGRVHPTSSEAVRLYRRRDEPSDGG